MTTGLWLGTSGLPASALTDAVPPACRRTVDALHVSAARGPGTEVLLEGPEWPVAGASHFVPSFTALTTMPCSVRLELCVRVDGAWTPWVGGVVLGDASFPPLPASDALDVEVDVFRTRMPVQAARVRARVVAIGREATTAPSMLALSAADAEPPVSSASRPLGPVVALDVPALSQMDADPTIARRICSPTCVAMVLGFWGRPAPVVSVAEEVFHAGTDLYGVWPSAILAGGRRGLAGYLLRFPDWNAAAWCLAHGLPVIASVRYAAGELSGAAVAETPGHLLVLTGWQGEQVLVNDPGAPNAAAVSRRYRIDELVRVWLERAGVGYVFFPPPASALRGG
jgi:hypothetical protein